MIRSHFRLEGSYAQTQLEAKLLEPPPGYLRMVQFNFPI